MKLTHIEIKNYRSLYHSAESRDAFQMRLGDGVNCITGPNNSGKSNILRALALALDPEFEFNRELDTPAWVEGWAKPAVTLTFQVPTSGAPSREKTLLKRLQAYEEKASPGISSTYASKNELRLRVTIERSDDSRGQRRRTFVAKGAGARSLADDDPTTLKALEQFDKCLQFILVRSGESLESLLRGRFHDVLQSILRDGLKAELEEAVKSRERYVQALQDGLLDRLRERISEEINDLFPEVDSVELEPDVRGLEDTLTAMQVSVSDAATTDLADKGTGVRGGLIVALLQHLAAVSKRSIVFAVEEPESFLHPAAQEALREDLEALTSGRDVSLVVTTHSPYILSRQPSARSFSIRKAIDGRTLLHAAASGGESFSDVMGGLFRSSIVVGFLERAARASSDEGAILVLEGETDRSWLRLAAQRAKRPELLQGLSLVVASDGVSSGAAGANIAGMQALVLAATATTPVAILLDNDEEGRRIFDLFRQINSKAGGWKKRERLFNYKDVFTSPPTDFPYEAEDLWPDSLHEDFVSVFGKGVISEMEARPNPDGGFHYGYRSKAKPDLAVYLEEHVRAEHCDRWVALLEIIREGVGLDGS